MVISDLFWKVLGLGIAIPFTLVLIVNLIIKVQAGDSYELNLKRLGTVYIIALLGWSIFLGIGGA